MLMNLTGCMRYWDNLLVFQLLVRCILKKTNQSSSLCWLTISKSVPNVSVYRPDSLFLEQLGV